MRILFVLISMVFFTSASQAGLTDQYIGDYSLTQDDGHNHLCQTNVRIYTSADYDEGVHCRNQTPDARGSKYNLCQLGWFWKTLYENAPLPDEVRPISRINYHSFKYLMKYRLSGYIELTTIKSVSGHSLEYGDWEQTTRLTAIIKRTENDGITIDHYDSGSKKAVCHYQRR